MHTRVLKLFLIIGFCLATTLDGQSIAGNGATNTSSATGHLTTLMSTADGIQKIIISFNAIKDAYGHTTGNATIQFLGSTIQVDIRCLRFMGSNTAVLSGPVTRTDNPWFERQGVYFLAVDNGEGGDDPPDGLLGLITNTSCDETILGTPGLVERGDLQVRP